MATSGVFFIACNSRRIGDGKIGSVLSEDFIFL
jgi:hypothetical protein